MTFAFGPFRLDEERRVLLLREREAPLQPRVFDLLVYLVQNRARVVSKDELLENLWPGVLVTDNSIQRAVSTLRGVLREGGMEEAVRNYPRSGYRFSLESDAAAHAPPDRRAAATQAIEQQRWADAVAHYTALDGSVALDGDDLDRWALAQHCLGKPSEAVPLLMRAIAAHASANDEDAAAASAVLLSMLHLERGEGALANGWLSRASDWVAQTPNGRAGGFLKWMQARIAAFEGDPRRAIELSDAAYEFGRRCADPRTEALGLMYRGFFRMSVGDTRGGLADQDHASTMALSGRLDPITGSLLYCNVLWACRTFGDWARANEWTIGYQRFCTSQHMEFSGSCQLHRAEVLGVQGSLQSALEHVHDSLARLKDDAPWAQGDAQRVLGDIQAAIGDDDAAFAAYQTSYALGWSPEPGNAMLLLERGDAEAAYASLERSLIGQNWFTLQRQGVLLAHLALAAVHAGKPEKAQALINDLTEQDQRWPMASIRALTNEAAALLARERGDASEALRRLHLARQLWTSLDSRLHAARLRLEIATLQLAEGDRSGAATEVRAASAVAEELGALKLQRRCRELTAKL